MNTLFCQIRKFLWDICEMNSNFASSLLNIASMCGCSLLVILDTHLFNQAIQVFVVLCLTDRPGGKECVQQVFLTAKKLQLLFCGGQRGPCFYISNA